jgi:hypothetical protein
MACQKALGTRNANSCSLARAENSPLNNQGNSERPSGRLDDFSLLRLPLGKFGIYVNKGLARGKTEQSISRKLHPVSRTVRLRRIATVHGSLRRFSTFRRLRDKSRRIATTPAKHTSAQRQQTPVVEHKGIGGRGCVFPAASGARSGVYVVGRKSIRVRQNGRHRDFGTKSSGFPTSKETFYIPKCVW